MTERSPLDRVFAELPRSMTVNDVAELLHTSERTVLNALKSGKLPGHKPLGEWVIFREELQEHFQQLARERRDHPTSD